MAVGPDGTLIDLKNAKPFDEYMLELMRRRDQLPKGSAERKEIEAEIERIKAISNKDTLSVVPDDPYSFYVRSPTKLRPKIMTAKRRFPTATLL